jgi:GTPase SAR1 family protein
VYAVVCCAFSHIRSRQNTPMAAQQQTRPEFKLVLVGDGGVGM